MIFPRLKYVASKTIKGIDFNFYTSSKPTKKYMVMFTNPETGREKVIHFGDIKYQHYYDGLSNVYQSLWHMDPKRRDSYRARHFQTAQRFPSPSWFSYNFLW